MCDYDIFFSQKTLDLIVLLIISNIFQQLLDGIIRWTLSCSPNIVRSIQTVKMPKFVAIISLFYESVTGFKMCPFHLMG